MKWKVLKARTPRIKRTGTQRHDLEHYCRDLNGWPGSWMGLEKDLPPGEQLLSLFRPFLESLAASELSPKTIQKHVDNMWVLGGEFIRDLHNDPSQRRKPVYRVLRQMIEFGGPLLYHGGEDQQRSFDSTWQQVPPIPYRDGSLTLRRHPQISQTRRFSYRPY